MRKTILRFIYFTFTQNPLKLVKTIIVLGILITGSYFASKYYVDNKDGKLKKEIWAQINDIFSGKDVVWDGYISQVRAEHENVPQGYYEEDCSELVTYFKKQSGGFEIIQGKILDSEEIWVITFTSTNMGYKGYSYYNPSVDECYQSAFNYLTNEYDNKVNANGYRPRFYNRIQNISYISNEYYFVGGFSPRRTPPEHFIPQTKYIGNNFWKVFYTESGYLCYVMLDWNAKQNDFRKIFGISTLVIILLSFVFLYNPQSKKR